MELSHRAVAIIPCSDLDQSQAFYERLGFALACDYETEGYCILDDAKGATVHLTKVDPACVDPERNAHGIYFYSEDVEALAAAIGVYAHHKPWGLKEFAVSDPNGTLVRVGWPV